MVTISTDSDSQRIAILPLRNAVLFPMSVVPINVGRPRSVRLVEHLATLERALVGVVAQRDPETVEPDFEDIHRYGTLARVVKVIRLGPSNYSVVLNGLSRFELQKPVGLEPQMTAEIRRLREVRGASEDLKEQARVLRESMREVLSILPEVPRETSGILDNVHEPGALADLIASNFTEDQASISERQHILEATEPEERVDLVLSIVRRQLTVLKAKEQITDEIQEEMGSAEREYILREQMKTIREELGESADEDDVDALRTKVMRAGLPKEAADAARKQLSRLRAMQSQSSEYHVTRNYVEWLSEMPWTRESPDQINVKDVARCLDEDHHGLDKVKRRVVEFAAIRQLRRDKRGPILLFVGPPGVGKTSLGRSIARATGRRYGRIALGGVRDEAEIRGHRRTYVGALPGRIIQALKKVGTKNPVLVLDEVDKMGADMRGDPAAALLEVLDPEQNGTFTDHYLNVPFDLSQVIFLATANNRAGIPEPLRDRMETIDVSGYTRKDKLSIADQFLVPKQLREHGLTESDLQFRTDGVELLIDCYTREAGVRNLEREIASVCRATAVRIAEGEHLGEGEVASRTHVERVLGTRRYDPEVVERTYAPGVSNGMISTGAGAELSLIEARTMPGKGKIHVTGSLPKVMNESAHAAVSFVRSRAERLEIPVNWLEKTDLHLHIPRARAARDAAGLGVPILVAVVSRLLRIATLPDVATVGELTLRGSILRVHDVKAKILGAHRAGVKVLLLPESNLGDLEDVPADVLAELEVQSFDTVEQVLARVLDPSGRVERDSRSRLTGARA